MQYFKPCLPERKFSGGRGKGEGGGEVEGQEHWGESKERKEISL